MSNINWLSHLAYWPESTPGTGPADASAWGTNGLPIRHDPDSLDVSGFQQTPIEDTRNKDIGFGLDRKQRGLKSGEFPFTVHLAGGEAVPAIDATIAQTRVSRLLKHAMGGEQLGNHTFCKVGGTHAVNSVEVDDTTNIVLGSLINVVDDDAPGIANIRQVIGISTDVLTLDEDLPFTPVDNDDVHAVITNYIDETVLSCSHTQTNTFSWHIRKGITSLGTELWEATCCKSALTSIEVGRDDLLRASFNTMFAAFQGPNDLSLPTFSNSEGGLAGTIIGPTVHCQLQDYGEDTQNSVKVASITIDPGIPVTRVETTTEATAGSAGTGTYSFTPADTLITLNLVGLTSSFWDDWDDDVFKLFRYSTRRADGKNIAICAPRCEVVQTPQRSTANDVSSTSIVLRAHPNTTTTATTALWRSKLLIGHC